MRGTIHENDWYFYHDALSLMTATSMMKWMEDTTIDGVIFKDI